MLAVEYPSLSMLAGAEVVVVTVPVFEGVAVPLTVTAAEFVQLKQ
jgi:hypothetical protein